LGGSLFGLQIRDMRVILGLDYTHIPDLQAK